MSQSDSIYELGKKLVLELGLENEVDTLSRWMAHHLAELIKEAEIASGQDKARKARECRDAIIDLWKARHILPNGKRPFESFEGIFRAIERLDPENTTPRYFMAGRPRAARSDEQLSHYLELIEGIDYTARVLIEFALGEAVALSKGSIRDWLRAAQGDSREAQDIEIIVRLVSKSDELEDLDPKGEQREVLQNRLERLERFQQSAGIAIAALQEVLHEQRAPLKAKRTKKATEKSVTGEKVSRPQK